MKKLIILTFISIFTLACNSKSDMHRPLFKEANETSAVVSESIGLEDEMQIIPPNSHDGQKTETSSLEKGSKIIKEGNMRIEVDDLSTAKSFIDSLVAKSTLR